MQYDSMLSGSPLIPSGFLFAYAIIISGIFIFSALQDNGQIKKTLLFSLSVFHGIIIVMLVSAAVFFLGSTPKVVKTAYQMSQNKTVPAIEITFDKPVMRQNLSKSISPSTAGIWLFENPLYATHLYRKVSFYPYVSLTPKTAYTVDLSGIRNFLGSKTDSHTIAFNTSDVFDVLGDSTTKYAKDKIAVTGSFPSNGWNGVAVDTTIRIRFNQIVDTNSVQEHFSLSPSTTGTFKWDGDTLVFTPTDYLSFATQYNFLLTPGITNAQGLVSTEKYSVLFTTQEETTKLTVPAMLQKYTLSCEIAALRMVLAYRGVTASEDELLQKIGFDPNAKRGNTWGNPYVGFVGNVKGTQMATGYGVYWEPVAKAANSYRLSKSFENWTIEELTQSIQKSTPVIAWISVKGRTPTLWQTPGGDKIKVVPDEHAVVVTGFLGPANNPSHIIVNDPLIGEAYWTRDAFEKKWISLSNSGVLVF